MDAPMTLTNLINAVASYAGLETYKVWGLYIGGTFMIAAFIRDYLARKGYRV